MFAALTTSESVSQYTGKKPNNVRSRTATGGLAEAESPRWNGGVYEDAKIQDTKVGRRLLGKNICFVQRVQLATSAKHA